jgi:Domain of unknown function (DUF222)
LLSVPPVSVDAMSSDLFGIPVHPVANALNALADGLDGSANADIWAMSDDGLTDAVEACERMSARVAELGLRLVREVDARDLARRQGAPSATAWLRHRLRIRPGEARSRVELANRLRNEPPIDGSGAGSGSAGWTMPATAAALAEGTVSVEHAAVVAATMSGLPVSLSAEQVRAVEHELAGWARSYNPTEVANLGRALTNLLDQDTLDERKERAHERREFRLTDRGDGSTRISGQLDYESAAIVRAALDPLAAPAPATDGEPDRRSSGQRYADALVELARRGLDSGDLPSDHAVRPHITVTIRVETLLAMAGERGVSVGELAGGPISAETARRLGCDAGITRVILDSAGMPLDVGREQRTVTPAQWAALLVRDGGCAFPACPRPPEWCEAHHVVWWINGGQTDLDNLVLLCGYHHRVIHHHGWDVHMNGDGYPEFLPPPWIDPARSPRRNSRPRPHTVTGPGP